MNQKEVISLSTKLRGIDFGPVWAASGAMGFFGKEAEYWPHWLLIRLGLLGRQGLTLVAKTVTLNPRKGNMRLSPKQYRMMELMPKSIKAQFRHGNMLNAVGLSNPGLEALLATGEWQQRRDPFMVSVMCMGATPEERAEEMADIARLLERDLVTSQAPFGVQVNLSCPNTEHDPKAMTIEEVKHLLGILSVLDVPLIPKFSLASSTVENIVKLEDDPNCDGICVSNTIPFGWEGIDWQKVWGSQTSPLAKFGGGGLSGVHLAPLVCEFIRESRAAGFTKHINGGGGIMNQLDVDRFHEAGADSFFVGSAVTLRPWEVKGIIERAYQVTRRGVL